MIKHGFNVKNGITSYTQNHKGSVVCGVAKLCDLDTNNPELGKAIAYARCDLKIRKRELEMAKSAKYYIESDLLYNPTNRFFKKYLNDVNEQIAHMRKMIKNQNKMIDILCYDGYIIAGDMDYRNILRKTLRIVLDNLQYK